MTLPKSTIQEDIDAVSQIPVIRTILETICLSTGMGFSAVARVTEDKWVCCAVNDEINFGLKPGGELKLETTICNEIRQSGIEVVIDHVAEDSDFANHHTPAMYGFQSYISIPIFLQSGDFFGTLCAIDPRPAKLKTPAVVSMFRMYAELISFHLDSVKKLKKSDDSLRDELETADLREQFIAILGHDLRNPAGAVANAAKLLLRMPLEDRALRLAHIIQDSSYRIKGLIDNILDFARGRLGDGITLNLDHEHLLEDTLDQVITELRIVWPDRTIERSFENLEPVTCDTRRISQLFSNLLGNALTHGKADSPVFVHATTCCNTFKLSVINQGEPIPEHAMKNLFKPFARGTSNKSQQGLGLGLYIASEIAQAHGGKMEVASSADEICFTLTMPTCPNDSDTASAN